MQRRSVLRNLKKTLTLAHIALAWAMVPAEAQVSYESAESVYEQNFDGLPSTGSTFTWTDNETIPGWYAGNSAGTSFNPAGISTGSTTTGDLYSFGSSGSTDRALGSIGSGTVGNMWWGVQLVNTTGETITAFTLSYTGEQWRRASMEQQAISVEYSLTATALKTGTYQAIPALTFISPDTGGSNGARDGNQSAYRTSIGPVTVNNIHWAPGEALWIRFFDPDHTGSDHGLAIDDFSFSVAEASSSYDPPSGYYDSAQGLSGDVLAGALRDIVSPHTVVPNVEGAIQVLEEDPEDASRIVLTYSGTSVLKSDVSWAVEFLWPAGRGIEASGADASDLFNLRAAYADVITARADKIFDYSDEEDGSYLTPAHLLAAVGTSTDSDSWEPATDERGDIARALFYMDVRYNGTEANTTDLVLENQIGNPEDMAVLTTLLEWHHADPVNEAERLRNHRIYTLYQQNRNPFIDHPIYADLIFGDFVAQAQDLDLDGIPTYWEVAHQQDPEDPTDAGEDTDGDGFSNFEEYWMGTDPNSASDPVTLHVDAVYTGSVQNGTATHPYKTIQAAANAVPENQLRAILVNPGTYLGPYITGKKKIHLFSEQGAAATVIEANPTNSSVVRLYDFERASLVGFTIRDAVTTWYGAGVRIDAPAGKLLLANNIITNNTTTNTTTGGGGVYLKTATGSRMVNNIIHGNQAVRGGGVLFAGGNTEFWHNTIANNAATGGNGGGLSAIQGVTPDVRNNILWQNTGNGANAQLHQIPAATSNLVQNAAPNSGNIDADPLFVDPANGDYHITANSPARNTAIPLGLAEDIDLDPRSDTTDGQKDIGADEIVSLDPEPTPTPTPEPTPEPTPPPFIDTDGNGIDDNWELRYFEIIGIDPNGLTPSGLTYLQAYQHGLDPTKESTNDIGIPDAWLIGYGFNPLTADPNSDEDEGVGDGLALLDEYRYNTDPDNTDTDGDGVDDGPDGWALDPDLAPPRLPEPKYAIIDLSSLGISVAHFISDDGLIAYTDNAGNWGLLKDMSSKHPVGFDILRMSKNGRVLGFTGHEYITADYIEGTGVITQTMPEFTGGYVLPGATRTLQECVPSDISSNGVVGTASGGSSIESPGEPTTSSSYITGIHWGVPSILNGATMPMWHRPNSLDSSTILLNSGVCYIPFKINDNGDSYVMRQQFAAGAGGGAWSDADFGILYADGTFSEIPSQAVNAINSADPILAIGSRTPQIADEEARFWVATDSGFIEKPAGAWQPSLNSPHVQGYLNGVNDRYEVAVALASESYTKVGDVIRNGKIFDVDSGGYEILGCTAINSQGILLAWGRKNFVDTQLVLVPVEIYDDNINSPSVAWNGETISLTQIQTPPIVITKAFINKVAWIDPITSASDPTPRMPKLIARVNGASANMQIEWWLVCKHGRSGNRDDIELPKASHKTLPGDEPWNIFEHYSELSPDEQDFFGGDAEVHFIVQGQAEQTIKFKILGKNPEDQVAYDYINSIANPLGFTFAWGIAKHESHGTRPARYNQFAEVKGSWGDQGEPWYSPLEGDGWGMFQRDASGGGIPVTTKQAWSWMENCDVAVKEELVEKAAIADAYLNSLQAAHPNEYAPGPPSYDAENSSVSARAALIMTLYNGLSPDFVSRTVSDLLHFYPNNPPGVGSGKRWQWDLPNARGKSKPYANYVIIEMKTAP